MLVTAPDRPPVRGSIPAGGDLLTLRTSRQNGAYCQSWRSGPGSNFFPALWRSASPEDRPGSSVTSQPVLPRRLGRAGANTMAYGQASRALTCRTALKSSITGSHSSNFILPDAPTLWWLFIVSALLAAALDDAGIDGALERTWLQLPGGGFKLPDKLVPNGFAPGFDRLCPEALQESCWASILPLDAHVCKAAITSRASFRSRPWSTKKQVSWSPTAWWTSAVATAESTPPLGRRLPSPADLSLQCCYSLFHIICHGPVSAMPQMRRRKLASISPRPGRFGNFGVELDAIASLPGALWLPPGRRVAGYNLKSRRDFSHIAAGAQANLQGRVTR